MKTITTACIFRDIKDGKLYHVQEVWASKILGKNLEDHKNSIIPMGDLQDIPLEGKPLEFFRGTPGFSEDLEKYILKGPLMEVSIKISGATLNSILVASEISGISINYLEIYKTL